MSLWNERSIASAISQQTLAKKCVVLVDNCNWTGNECDVLGVTTDLRIIDIEIKISRADLKADIRKDKWWHRYGSTYDAATRTYLPGVKTAKEYPNKVWKHYYAMPADIWKPELLDCLPSKASGILLLRNTYPNDLSSALIVKVERRATPNRDAPRLTAQQTMNIARLANLRMWEMSNRLDAMRRQSEKLLQKAA